MLTLDNITKYFVKHYIRKNCLTTILSDQVPFYNGFGTPSAELYCKIEVVDVILVETLGRIEDKYLGLK